MTAVTLKILDAKPAWCPVCLLSCAVEWTLNLGTFTECPECEWNPVFDQLDQETQ